MHKDVVTVCLSYVVGLTKMSADMSRTKTFDLHDRLYTKLDALAREMLMFEVETIGNAHCRLHFATAERSSARL